MFEVQMYTEKRNLFPFWATQCNARVRKERLANFTWKHRCDLELQFAEVVGIIF